jgi:ComF family protein
VISSILSALWGSNRCAACDAPSRANAVFCVGCALVVERTSDPRAPFVYGGPIAAAITRFKYLPAPDLARPLGELLATEASRLAIDADVVVPVPLHPSRLFERGFNQAALLARPVARVLGLPLLPRALVRTRATAKQAELDRAERLRNVEGAFRARRPLPPGTRALVVDDVLTTGATQNACAAALREAGCRSVNCLVLAIAPAMGYP